MVKEERISAERDVSSWFAARGEIMEIENKIMKSTGGWQEFANFNIRGENIFSVRGFSY